MQCYTLRLTNLRRILEGVTLLSTIKKPLFDEEEIIEQPIPKCVTDFFSNMKVEILSEIDENHKIIKYTFKEESDIEPEVQMDQAYQEVPTSFCFVVSYSVIGSKQDQACISLFEYNQTENVINPHNFLIITQKINKDAKLPGP